jgi:tRNA threonylcarbamoyladenosine biosynthesis protein TsaB
MSTILCIDTALPLASVSFSQNGNLLSERISDAQKDHAAFLHPAIHSISKELQIELQEINAVAVTIGPGSYTGLRVGLASAKGLCYALKKPLISLCTLETMAKQTQIVLAPTDVMLFCPMIDARRMEVYSAIFDKNHNKIKDVEAEILTENSYQDFDQTIYFVGDSQEKCKTVLVKDNFKFLPEIVFPSANEMSQLSFEKFQNNDFKDVAYFEPFYLKDFMLTK